MESKEVHVYSAHMSFYKIVFILFLRFELLVVQDQWKSGGIKIMNSRYIFSKQSPNRIVSQYSSVHIYLNHKDEPGYVGLYVPHSY